MLVNGGKNWTYIEGMKTVSVAALFVSCKIYFNKRLVKIRPLSARGVYVCAKQ